MFRTPVGLILVDKYHGKIRILSRIREAESVATISMGYAASNQIDGQDLKVVSVIEPQSLLLFKIY